MAPSLTGPRPLGALLVEQGVIDERQVRKARLSQGVSGERFATECLRSGFADEAALVTWLSLQVGVPGVVTSSLVLSTQLLRLLPRELAVRHRLLPIRLEAERILVAASDPELDDRVMAELALRAGAVVVACVALDGPLRALIGLAYDAMERGESEYRARVPTAANADGPEIIAAERPQVGGATARSAAAGTLVELSTAELALPVESLGDGLVERGEPLARPKGNRVLVIEDDADNATLISRILRRQGLDVDVVNRGLAGLNALRQAVPDLLILDAMLPEIHGFDIAKKVKGSERYRHVPIIMMSSIYRGWRIAEDLEERYRIEAFIEKPFKLDLFMQTVDRLLARKPRRRLPATGAQDAYRDGMACYRRKDLPGAIAGFEAALRVDGLSPKLHYQLGVLYLKKGGMLHRAMHVLEQAVELEPRFFLALRSLAVLYERAGFRNKAVEMWERALQCSPDTEMSAVLRQHLRGLL